MHSAAKPASVGMPSRHFALSKVGQERVGSRSPPSCHSRVLEPEDPSEICVGIALGYSVPPLTPNIPKVI